MNIILEKVPSILAKALGACCIMLPLAGCHAIARVAGFPSSGETAYAAVPLSSDPLRPPVYARGEMRSS